MPSKKWLQLSENDKNHTYTQVAIFVASGDLEVILTDPRTALTDKKRTNPTNADRHSRFPKQLG